MGRWSNVLLLQTLETAYLAEVRDLMVVNASATCDLTKKKSKDALVMRLEAEIRVEAPRCGRPGRARLG